MSEVTHAERVQEAIQYQHKLDKSNHHIESEWYEVKGGKVTKQVKIKEDLEKGIHANIYSAYVGKEKECKDFLATLARNQYGHYVPRKPQQPAPQQRRQRRDI